MPRCCREDDDLRLKYLGKKEVDYGFLIQFPEDSRSKRGPVVKLSSFNKVLNNMRRYKL